MIRMEEKFYYRMETQEVIKSLGSSERGIKEEEANARREKYGLNELPRGKRTSLMKLFFEQFKDILILAIFVAIILQIITIYIPVLNPVFHTYPLDWVDWILIVAVSSSVVGVTELFKALLKWWDKRVSQYSSKS